MGKQQLTYRVGKSDGNGWYWVLIGPDRAVIAKGLADTELQARADAVQASIERREPA
jgi:hypothetical protein